MSANDKANQFTDGMKQEYDRIAQGLKEGGPDSSHLREGENTEGLLNRYGPGSGSAFPATDNAAHGASNLLDSAKEATGLGQSRTEQAGQSVADGAKSFGQGAKEEFNAVTSASGPSSGATTGDSILETVKSYTGFGQTKTEQAGQEAADGMKSFGQGAKDEFNAITSSGPSSGASTGDSLLESAKSATGLGQSKTERAGQDASDAAKSFGQGAKDEFNAITSSGPSSGASTGDSLLESAKSATGLGQSKTERAGQDVADGMKSFGQGAKDEFNAATSSGPSSGASTGESLFESLKSATGFGQSKTEEAGQSVADGARSLGQGAKDEFNSMSSGPSSGTTTGESLLDQVKSATGFGQTQTEQAGQSVADGARSFGQGAKDEFNSVTSGFSSDTAATTTGGGHTTADSLVNQAADSQRLV